MANVGAVKASLTGLIESAGGSRRAALVKRKKRIRFYAPFTSLPSK